MGKIKEYSNGETTVVWEAEKCIHSAICAKGLPEVFQPRDRPWVKIDGANTESIINQVKEEASKTTEVFEQEDQEQE